jgi:AAA ATPase domain
MDKDQQNLRRKIMGAFEPFEPAESKAYVNCQSLRGDWDVVVELGNNIVYSEKPTCQLFSGHKGSGKSTELTRRLQDYLKEQGFLVVYFAADGRDQELEPGDVHYADILFSCVRHLIEQVPIKDPNKNPLADWLETNWGWITDFIPSKLSFEEVKIKGNIIPTFAEVIATIRTIPDKRKEVRQRINEKAQTLLQALNEFIAQVEQRLSTQQQQGIVLIVDNLDRIPSIENEERRNCREIYINRSTLMRGLNCHVIYTVPISMIYSDFGAELRDSYGSSIILPMLMVRHPDGQVYRVGIDILRQLIRKRLEIVDPQLVINLDGTNPQSNLSSIFENSEVLDELCLMSGGRVRDLMRLIQSALKYSGDQAIITESALKRTVQELCLDYENNISSPQWDLLAKIASSPKTTENDPSFVDLLRNAYLLEYRFWNDGELNEWQDVHPLITKCKKFRGAIAKIQGG